MSTFTVSLAGTPVEITTLSPNVQAYFSEFLCSETPLFSVAATEEDIEREREYSDRTDEAEGIIDRRISRSSLEKMFLLRVIAEKMIEYNTFLFHGSVVAVNGNGYLFTAPSGTGKTTHTRLWLDLLPQAYVINGDKPFLKVTEEGKVLVCGVPWRGKENLGCNEIVPLKAICVLERSPDNRIREVDSGNVISCIIHQTYIPDDVTSKIKVFQLLDKVVRRVRLYRLECNMDPEAAEVSIGAMLKDENAGC